MMKIFNNFTFIICAAMISQSASAEMSTLQTIKISALHPQNWGYISSSIQINDRNWIPFNEEITLPISIGNKIDLNVYAMNSKSELDSSCLKIEIKEQKKIHLFFELKQDWKIHCFFGYIK
ncbi:hypothetical protein [Fluviispira vulneris]|uniref:hypothetical protein n=1 Tax=Fluviispira vulneris TaxID=2763012 RepID=UPI00164453F3|nr:hypothetical protein [Fluviispira vulneris]